MRTPRLPARFAVFATLFLFCSGALSAQPAHLVEDIDQTTRPGGLSVTEMAELGSSAYFGASAPSSFEQLWTSDGTTEGTWKLRDFDVTGSSQPRRFTRVASGLFFFVGQALWKLDAAGKSTLVKELPAEPHEIAVLRDMLVMTVGFRQLWRSDGTPEGTYLLANLPGLPPTSGLASAGGFVYFFAHDTGTGTATLQLWATDGTVAGTRSRVELGPVEFWISGSLGGALIFITREASDRPYKMWRSDGTVQGTTPIATFVGDTGSVCELSCLLYGPTDFTAAGGRLFFIANDGVHGRELWRTDGSPGGTALVRDVNPGYDAGLTAGLLAAGNRVYFAGQDPEHGTEVWVSNGTPSGTTLVEDITPGPESSLARIHGALGDRAILSGRNPGDLWITDGDAAGATPLIDLHTPYQAPYGFTAVGGDLLFLAPVEGGSTLWRTDGTTAGTRVVDEFVAGHGVSPSLLTDVGGTLMFVGNPDDRHAFRDLWRSDGTETGTSLVESFVVITEAKALGGQLFFAAFDGQVSNLWKTDPSGGGPIRLHDLASASGLTPAGSLLFFRGWDDAHGEELWVADGTTGGTRIVRDVRPGGENSSIEPLGALEGHLYFTADDGVHGKELWRSDGTEAGTVLVKEIRAGPEGCVCPDAAIAFGRVFFGAYDGSEFGLWSTDGTEAGTYSLGPFPAHRLTAAGNLLYFTNFDDSRLFRSDGTAAGTRVVHEGPAYVLVGSSHLLYFIGDGLELWRSDGTEAGTRMIRDIRPGEEGSMRYELPPALGTVGSLAVFAANDGEHGMEVWVSDGTDGGTRMIQDISSGGTSSNPTGFRVSGGLVYFNADDGVTGQELWAVPVEALRTPPTRGLEPPARHARPTHEVPERPSP